MQGFFLIATDFLFAFLGREIDLQKKKKKFWKVSFGSKIDVGMIAYGNMEEITIYTKLNGEMIIYG